MKPKVDIMMHTGDTMLKVKPNQKSCTKSAYFYSKNIYGSRVNFIISLIVFIIIFF